MLYILFKHGGYYSTEQSETDIHYTRERRYTTQRNGTYTSERRGTTTSDNLLHHQS